MRASNGPAPEPPSGATPADRSLAARVWYESIRWTSLTAASCSGGLRATGREHLPASGGVLLVSNHLSHLDVFVLGIPLRRRLNYVARSTLFKPVLGTMIRSVGGFPIQLEGKGAGGLKETLKRLKQGSVVVLFPEGARSLDGRLAVMKPGVTILAERARVPIVPAAVAGTFEAWPRTAPTPMPHAVRIVYGPQVSPVELAGLDSFSTTALLHERIAACHRLALRQLARDVGVEPEVRPS